MRFFWIPLLFVSIGLLKAETRPNLTEKTEALTNLEITGTFSVMNPNRLILSSREYKVSYSNSLLGISSFQLGIGLPTPSLGRFRVMPFSKVGYARNQGTYSLTAQDGTKSESQVTLHWLPLSAGLRTEYSVPGFDLIRPYLSVSGGAEWLNQQGTTPGVSESFWIPFYNVGLGLSFADAPLEESTGFGGFSFSMNLQNGLRENQEARILSYDLTVHFFL